jgi:hypothetical protein
MMPADPAHHFGARWKQESVLSDRRDGEQTSVLMKLLALSATRETGAWKLRLDNGNGTMEADVRRQSSHNP